MLANRFANQIRNARIALVPKGTAYLSTNRSNDIAGEATNTASGRYSRSSGKSRDDWGFLFEDTGPQISEPSLKSKPVLRKGGTPHGSKYKRILSSEEMESFNNIFSTLFSKPKLAQAQKTEKEAGLPAIERHLLYLIENNESVAQSESHVRPKASNAASEERLNNLAKSAAWFRKTFEGIPATHASRHRTHWIGSVSMNADEQIKLDKMIEDLSKCNTNYDFRVFVWAKIFKRGAVGRSPYEGDPFAPKTFPPGYPDLLKASIAHCRNVFRDPYMALSIFEQAKRQGLESYVVGCDTLVYNEILKIRWDFWKDVQGMDALLTEMQSNGVLFNLATKGIIESAFEESRIGGLDSVKHDLKRLLTFVETSIDASTESHRSSDRLDRPLEP
ncbi:4384_t:CDS:2 [Paraglomus occultum]|uniref:4384_t:CDS:1 n=1 Tax=Paraglomus occultum TaxID=144539 RepID=A0A9N8VKC7_9GLOM|nr:4384_t:CDS:2 [Paraglomus occultum]